MISPPVPGPIEKPIEPDVDATPALSLRVGSRSERGRREENQDQMAGFASPFGIICLVADGMGGHRGGADAARLVAEGYNRHLAEIPAITPLRDALQSATTAVNADIIRYGISEDSTKRGLGSTVVLAVLQQASDHLTYVTGHAGDSRAYLLAGGEITRLTRDHSMVQRLVEGNMIAAEDAAKHPRANVLLRAFGQGPELQLEISEPRLLERGARLLLCTDGLWGHVPDAAILEEANRTGDPEKLANNLVELALQRGSDDNVTIQVICTDTSG